MYGSSTDVAYPQQWRSEELLLLLEFKEPLVSLRIQKGQFSDRK